MRFFDQVWRESEDAAFTDSVRDAYQEHIQGLLPRLPAGARQLAQINLHDALFASLRIDQATQGVQLQLVAGDRSTGYSNLGIRYVGCGLSSAMSRRAHRLVEGAESEILYDEIDLLRSGYVHRLWCWPDTSLEFPFLDLLLTTRQVPNREWTESFPSDPVALE